MSNEPFATGHCLCGAVSCTINAKPIRMAQCHCKDCQRASGTGHTSFAFFKHDDVTIHGATASYVSTADSGNIKTGHFCPTCGSRVYGENSGRPGVIRHTSGVSQQQRLVFRSSRRLHEASGCVGQDADGRPQLRADATGTKVTSTISS
jgi:hypothetical protein